MKDKITKEKIICIGRFLLDAVWFVPRFAMAMRIRLWKNRHKYSTGHWRLFPAYRWLEEMMGEVEELASAMKSEVVETESVRHLRKIEAVDISNYAMFTAYASKIDAVVEGNTKTRFLDWLIGILKKWQDDE